MMARKKAFKFESEAKMCEAFISVADAEGWQCYAETCGFDILAVHRETGYQCGIEAKQQFNTHVLTQCVERFRQPHITGPDLLAVLVPEGGTAGLDKIASFLGVTVIRARGEPVSDGRGNVQNMCHYETQYFRGGKRQAFIPFLPERPQMLGRFQSIYAGKDWVDLCPQTRCELPDYIPDVKAGCASPLTLTPWKVKAIKIVCVLEERGYVTGQDFKSLGISMSRWTQQQWLMSGDIRKQWVAGPFLPNFRTQPPTNFDQIKADIGEWGKDLLKTEDGLFAEARPQ